MSGRFRPGDAVRIKADDRPGHLRTPVYVRGRIGRIVALHGAFRNPETLAYGKDGLPKRPLYQVRFRQRDLWPDYDGAEGDTLALDIYEHWIEPGEAAPART